MTIDGMLTECRIGQNSKGFLQLSAKDHSGKAGSINFSSPDEAIIFLRFITDPACKLNAILKIYDEIQQFEDIYPEDTFRFEVSNEKATIVLEAFRPELKDSELKSGEFAISIEWDYDLEDHGYITFDDVRDCSYFLFSAWNQKRELIHFLKKFEEAPAQAAEEDPEYGNHPVEDK